MNRDLKLNSISKEGTKINHKQMKDKSTRRKSILIRIRKVPNRIKMDIKLVEVELIIEAVEVISKTQGEAEEEVVEVDIKTMINNPMINLLRSKSNRMKSKKRPVIMRLLTLEVGAEVTEVEAEEKESLIANILSRERLKDSNLSHMEKIA